MSRMGEDVIADITANRELIAHLHTAESPARSAPLAAGEIRYAPIVAAAGKAGFAGWWGLEFIPAGEALAELRAAAAMFRSL
jgi:hydroxypyruvate isomerase